MSLSQTVMFDQQRVAYSKYYLPEVENAFSYPPALGILRDCGPQGFFFNSQDVPYALYAYDMMFFSDILRSRHQRKNYGTD